VPLCLHLCIIPLVMCPGFWVGDIIGTCTMVSVPPMCTQAFFWNLASRPFALGRKRDGGDLIAFLVRLIVVVPLAATILNV